MMKNIKLHKKSLILSGLCALIMALPALAQNQDNHHTDHAYGPIGVMGEHPHNKGEWMASYRYSTMHMKGNRNGMSDVITSAVLTDFIVAPTEMTMQMHMFGLMYGASDRITLMGMLPYTLISMDHVNRMGVDFTTQSQGIGDAKLSGHYTIYEQGHRRFILGAGISLPTGSIDERDDTPAGANQKLPYPMQLGSGTYDFLPSATYSDGQGKWSWGAQANAILRLGENSNDYTLGNQYGLTAWGTHKLNDHISASLRLDGKAWGNIDGADPDLNPEMVPTARTDLRGGKRVDLFVGTDLTPPSSKLAGNRLAIEAGMPIYQNLDGPQLETDYRLTIGWQLAF